MQVAPPPTFARRNFLNLSFWAGIGIAVIGRGASLANALYPRRLDAEKSPVLLNRLSQVPWPPDNS
jgi:hypothetical protein